MAGEIKSMEWVAERTGIPVNTLRYYRMRGEGGPPSFRLGRRVVYDVADVERWIEDARAKASA